MVIDISYLSSNGSGLDTAGSTDDTQEKTLVFVVWKDILQTSDWTPASEVSCPTFKSVGWLVSETEDEIKIGGTLVVDADDPQGTPFGITAFPKGCVQEIKRLRLGDLPSLQP